MKIAHTFAQQLKQLGTITPITPVDNPVLRHVNLPLVQELDLDPSLFTQTSLLQALFIQDGCLNQSAIAQKYGGHQFGHWNPELGDGRGLLLGNTLDKQGHSHDLHLKGAGKTPYSRFGDGRAVLRSTIREYLASEALFHLGIPTSRALCLLSSDTQVERENMESAAMMIRTCESHLRFGHFEYFFHHQQHDKLEQLFTYCLTHYFSECKQEDNPHLAMFTRIVTNTALLIARWQAFGFAHGVMNTDNMSIHGITFDFGPYGFMDDFDPEFICNHSDHSGRYAFGQQPGVALWNLQALACAFSPYVEKEALQGALRQYESTLIRHYSQQMRTKLGIGHASNDDQALLDDLLQHMQAEQRDYTQTFRRLTQARAEDNPDVFIQHFIDREKSAQWFNRCQARWAQTQEEQQSELTSMLENNPKYILRNYLAQRAIEGAQRGDYTEFNRLLEILRRPYDEQEQHHSYSAPPPDDVRSLSISCSS